MFWLRIFLFALTYLAVSTLANHESDKEKHPSLNTNYIQQTIKKLARRNEQIAERVSKLPSLIRKAVIESSRSNSAESPVGQTGRILILKRSESSSSESSSSSSESSSSSQSSRQSRSKSRSSDEDIQNFGHQYPYPYGQLYAAYPGYSTS